MKILKFPKFTDTSGLYNGKIKVSTFSERDPLLDRNRGDKPY